MFKQCQGTPASTDSVTNDDKEIFVNGWKCLASLRAVLKSGDLAQHFSQAAQSSEPEHGLQNVDFKRFEAHCAAGIAATQDQLVSFMAKWIARLAKHSDFLKSTIPEYVDHVIKQWDTEWISRELLRNMRKWMDVTQRWNEMPQS